MTALNVTLRDMLKAGVHFGHQTRNWNPAMGPYIYGSRSRIHIINLEKTLPMLTDAMNFIGHVAANKGRILFVGTKPAASDIIEEEARRCGMPWVSHRWLGGMLTNYKTIRQSVRKLRELEGMFEKNAFGRQTKKEILHLTRDRLRLERSLGGIKKMGGLPDVLFVVDVGHEKIAIQEAARLKIPVVGIVDTNNTPAGIDYIIPGNDDSVRSIRLYVNAAADAVLEARGSQAGGSLNDVMGDEFVELQEQEEASPKQQEGQA